MGISNRLTGLRARLARSARTAYSRISNRLTRLRARLSQQPVLWLFLVTFLCAAWLNPLKIGLALWGICKLALFAFAGDWCDSRIFPGANPKALTGIEQGTAWKRKGLIVAASIVAGALLP